MKKYGVIIDITNNFLAFLSGHYIQIGVFLFIALSQPILPTIIKIKKYITL